MSMLRRVLPAGWLGLALLTTANHAGAEVVANSIPDLMVDLIARGANIGSTTPANYARSRNVYALTSPALAPNAFLMHKTFLQTLSLYDNIPQVVGQHFLPGNTPIYEALMTLKGDVVVSLPSTATTDNSALKEARKMLFKNNGLPTDDYIIYLRYEADYKKLAEKVANTTDPAIQQEQRASLSQLEREWEILGNRSAFAAAIYEYQGALKPVGAGLFATWLRTLAPSNIADDVSSALTSNEWLRFSYSTVPTRSLSLVVDDGDPTRLGPVKRLSFEGTVVWLDRPYLSSPFLVDRGWKTKSGHPVSSGKDEPMRGDLVPAIVSGLLLTKNTEMLLKEDLSTQALDGLNGDRRLNIDGISIPMRPDFALGYQKNQIFLPGPMIVGVIVDSLKMLPDPAPDRQWPN